MSEQSKTPSQQLNDQIAIAYTFFNTALFGGKLPPVVLTLSRRARAFGYAAPHAFVGRDFDQVTKDENGHAVKTAHELAINPGYMSGRSDKETLATLVHEMVHIWEFENGTCSPGGYHNKIWADKMESLGLIPSDTGSPGGKRTGNTVSHYIQEGGLFHDRCETFLAEFGHFSWGGVPFREDMDDELAKVLAGAMAGFGKSGEEAEKRAERKEKSAKSKTKFTCPCCGQNAWAKPGALILCGNCSTETNLIAMEAEE